jgi:tetratricopeptide (TPR) repeat protein
MRCAPLAVIAGFAGSVAAGACSDQAGDAIERGDRFYGQGRLDAAIAEYKFALRQEADERALLRLGVVYGERGEIETSRRYYADLLERDSSFRYQVAAGLSAAARGAIERGGSESAARALEPLLELGAGMIPRDLVLPLARFYWEDNEYEEALPLYLRVLAEAEEVGADVLYETARAFQELGACREAIAYYERYLSEAARRAPRRSEAEWSLGNCLYEAAEEDWQEGRPAAAQGRVKRLIQLGVPRTLQDRAHFLYGEMSLALGERGEALRAFEEVLRLNPSRTGPLVERAEARIREIRFGFE